MIIDHATISPISDNDEFFETLDSYIQEWFIGSENDEEFSRQINAKKPFLFSLQNDSKVFFLLISLIHLLAPFKNHNKSFSK